MNGIKIKLKKIKNIDEFEFIIPNIKGLYALTGENGSGKSTIISCAGASFYTLSFKEYFGEPYSGAEINLQYNNCTRIIKEHKGKWIPSGDLHITGFYEGSIVFGQRFRNNSFNLISKLSKVNKDDLEEADEFVIKGLGSILHDDETYYKDLYVLNNKAASKIGLKRMTYYYKHKGTLINQLNMSTGENLLITILSSLLIRLRKENYGDAPTFIFLDEIELALHSAALRRLVFFLKDLADKHNMVVWFSTHSVELIRNIPNKNIYYLQNYSDGSLEVLNPCYPAFATRNLESSHYGYDCIILVEDDLSKKIIDKILIDRQLLNNKRILVIPIGGYVQVIKFAHEAIKSNLMIENTKIIMVLDGDIKDVANKFMKNEHIGFSDQPQYLPIKSLEKFLLYNLTMVIDKTLYKILNDYIFQNNSLSEIIHVYDQNIKANKYDEDSIKNGKAFYSLLNEELHRIRKTNDDLVDTIVKYLFDSNNKNIIELTNFFVEKFKTI